MRDEPPPIHYEPGTLVRMLTGEETKGFYTNSLDRVVRQHGYIYVVVRWAWGKEDFLEEPQDEANPYSAPGWLCKSVATGSLEVLFPNEITTKEPPCKPDI